VTIIFTRPFTWQFSFVGRRFGGGGGDLGCQFITSVC